MRSFLFMTLMGLVLNTSLKSQYFDSKRISSDTVFSVSRLSFIWTPSQLIGRFSSNMFSIEKRLTDTLNIGFDYGQIRNREYNKFDETYFQNKSGYKIAVKVKRYVKSKNTYERPFWALELFYNLVKYQRNRTFQISCPGSNCTFKENRTYQLKNNELGFRTIAGYSMDLVGPFSLELEAGLGLKLINLVSTGKPEEISFTYGKFFREDGHDTNITANLSVRLHYRLK